MTETRHLAQFVAHPNMATRQVSSGESGRPLDAVFEHFERIAPAEAAKTGLSSAGMRAGAIVRGMRRSAQLRQADLASRVGVSQERISEIERGAGPQGPTFELLERIAAACGMVLVPMTRARAELNEHASEMTSADMI